MEDNPGIDKFFHAIPDEDEVEKLDQEFQEKIIEMNMAESHEDFPLPISEIFLGLIEKIETLNQKVRELKDEHDYPRDRT